MADAADWDARFRTGDHADSAPDPFLIGARPYLDLLSKNALALDLACGAGRHAVWLAEQGFRVTALDFSPEALAKAKQFAAARSVDVECRQADLEAPGVDLGRNAFGLIAGFFFLHRPLFAALREAVRPGGLVLYKTYTIDQLRYPGRPRHRMHLLEHNELLQRFEGFRILYYEERWTPAGTASIVAQKPGA